MTKTIELNLVSKFYTKTASKGFQGLKFKTCVRIGITLTNLWIQAAMSNSLTESTLKVLETRKMVTVLIEKSTFSEILKSSILDLTTIFKTENKVSHTINALTAA